MHVFLSGNSSAGRARPCQGRGREFESRFPLQIPRSRGTRLFSLDQRGLRGRVVMHRTATPFTPVRFRPQPPIMTVVTTLAGIAQLVEHDLAKVGVASSNLVFRSK